MEIEIGETMHGDGRTESQAARPYALAVHAVLLPPASGKRQEEDVHHSRGKKRPDDAGIRYYFQIVVMGAVEVKPRPFCLVLHVGIDERSQSRAHNRVIPYNPQGVLPYVEPGDVTSIKICETLFDPVPASKHDGGENNGSQQRNEAFPVLQCSSAMGHPGKKDKRHGKADDAAREKVMKREAAMRRTSRKSRENGARVSPARNRAILRLKGSPGKVFT